MPFLLLGSQSERSGSLLGVVAFGGSVELWQQGERE